MSIIDFLIDLFTAKKLKNYKSVQIGQTQAWYGRANAWPLDRSILRKELNAMAKAGVSGYLIEMSGWGRYKNQQWTDKWIKEVEEEYNWLLSSCRKRNIYLFVSIVNDNMGHNKYGDKGPLLEKVYGMAQKLVEIVKKGGSKGVYVQPVAETQTAAGKRFDQYCVATLGSRGFRLVYNGSGGHPSGAASGFQHFAVHPSKVSAANPSNAFVVSDHGLIIRELANGKLEGPGNPGTVMKWASMCRNKGCPVVGYYAFKYQKYDEGTINALGKGIKRECKAADGAVEEEDLFPVDPAAVEGD